MQKKILSVLTFLVILALSSPVSAQQNGTWGIAAGVSYVTPVAGLSDWFKPAYGFRFAAGQQQEDSWFFEGCIEYVRFDSDNLSGVAAEKLTLELEHIGILFSARYAIAEWGAFRPWFSVAVGPHYYKGTRGRIEPDPDLGIPLIAARTNEEWNWGFKAGAGTEIKLVDQLSIDLGINYRFIVGDLWPTLQQYIELEGVSGLQTVNVSGGIRYYFE